MCVLTSARLHNIFFTMLQSASVRLAYVCQNVFNTDFIKKACLFIFGSVYVFLPLVALFANFGAPRSFDSFLVC